MNGLLRDSLLDDEVAGSGISPDLEFCLAVLAIDRMEFGLAGKLHSHDGERYSAAGTLMERE